MIFSTDRITNYLKIIMEQNVIYLPLILAVVGLVYMFMRASWVKKQAPGSERMHTCFPSC